VGVSTLSEGDDHNQKNSIVNRVQDAIVPHSKSIAIVTSKHHLLCSFREIGDKHEVLGTDTVRN
jgi:hypothetical protein